MLRRQLGGRVHQHGNSGLARRRNHLLQTDITLCFARAQNQDHRGALAQRFLKLVGRIDFHDARPHCADEAQVVPGLLQTAEYTSAIMQAELADDRPEIIGQRVQVRMARQAVLTRNPPPELWAVMDEDVVRRPIGGRDVLRRQLLRLAEVSERPNVTLQILPFGVGAHRGLSGSFIVLGFPDGTDESLVYCEGLTGGVFRNRPEEFRQYLMSFESLRAAALSPKESVDLISSVARGNG